MSLILSVAARIITPIAFLLSLWLLIRGHDRPGGGFIAALVAGSAVVLQYLAAGLGGVRRFLPFSAGALAGVGLVVAGGYGIAGLVGGAGYLGGAVWEIGVPVLGEVKVAASLAFDLGVYLVVLGVVVTVIRYMGEEHE